MVTCSALKKIYRDKLRRQGVVFVYMQGTFDEVMERLSHRQGHFMKPSMLQSQFDILEEPGDDEIHVNVHIGQADPEHEAMAVAGALGLLAFCRLPSVSLRHKYGASTNSNGASANFSWS